ncbi:SRPBCC family protein [Maritalea sp. S77]|uniref:SRPBCC family protein n=1 Tax=Maritalea sp. S77 TaxID=3415125 RepID=UPI003C7CB16A
MPTITVSEQFNCPPETAFAVITDFENLADFIDGVVKVKLLTDGPLAIGTRFRETRVILGREAEEEMEVIELQLPTSITLYAFSHGTEYHSTYTLEPNATGTKVTLEFRAQPKTFMAKVMSAVFSRMVGQVADMLQKDLHDAKIEAEKRSQ